MEPGDTRRELISQMLRRSWLQWVCGEKARNTGTVSEWLRLRLVARAMLGGRMAYDQNASLCKS